MAVMELKSSTRRIKFLRVLCYLAILSIIFVGLNSIPKEKFILPYNNYTSEYSSGVRSDYQLQTRLLSISASAENETIAPIVSIIIPELNNTLVYSPFFYVTANITDSNPPLPGNVSIEITNITTSLFNASMTLTVASQWYFPWANITAYPNGETYIIRVRALDASANKNMGFSTDLYIYLDIPSSNNPRILNNILFVIMVCALFALIMIYINRKQIRVRSQE